MTSASSPPALFPEQVLSLLREHQSEWRERYQASAGSDVDVWVELDPLTPFATVHLKHELEQLLQRPIDLVRLRERMYPALRNAILEEGICA
ncbi:MAG: nucleotidyltransferase family protein [Prochlorococcaceae cyanobacterium]